jgi:hypothetical protein
MADEVTDAVPILQSQRGMILVIGMILFAMLIESAMIFESLWNVKPDMTAIGIFGAFVAAGGAFFFKDKAVEAVERIGKQ